MLLFRAKVDLGAMAMKGNSAFPKASALLFSGISRILVGVCVCGGLTPSSEMQSVNSTAPADRAQKASSHIYNLFISNKKHD